jgi:transketolase
MANAIRALSMDAVQAANRAIPACRWAWPMSRPCSIRQFLKFDPAAPKWPDRDRFVLSAGHGSMLIYSLLHLTGYAAPTMDDIRNFRQLHSPCAGHPENTELPGSNAPPVRWGRAWPWRWAWRWPSGTSTLGFGDDLVDHKTWVIAGDGCLMEGINHEAIGLAGNFKLGGLNVLWDDNDITIDGDTALSTCEDIPRGSPLPVGT